MSKVWFITGSSRGLGRELAKAVIAAGHKLVATARKTKDLEDLVAAGGDRVRSVALDVTDPAAARDAVAAAIKAFGRLDVVVNNAGYANMNSIEDMAEDDFRAQIETNFFGVVNVTRAALPVLRKQRGGHFLQISSIGGRAGSQGLSAYQSAKFAVEGFSEVLAKEVAHLGIRVTIVEPGGFRTDWAGSSMKIADITEDYKPSVGAFIQAVRQHADSSRGDPAKAARAILEITAEKEPLLRLLLGSDAVFVAKMISDGRAAEDARWKSLSMSTDVDGLLDFADSPVAQMLKNLNRPGKTNNE
jgi:NAD(P)-dependent dehydrogenase (short-subunit alcohol dehydrogenase family)